VSSGGHLFSLDVEGGDSGWGELFSQVCGHDDNGVLGALDDEFPDAAGRFTVEFGCRFV
jgi:hypothetical protein